MLEIGKRYMFNAKKALKNKVPNLYGEDTQFQYYNQKDGVWQLTGLMKPSASVVLWSEADPFEIEHTDAFNVKRKAIVQLVRVCRPFNGFEVTEIVVSSPGPLTFITEAMPESGQKLFEEKFFKDVVTEIINDLW